jgi:hypothetical protein
MALASSDVSRTVCAGLALRGQLSANGSDHFKLGAVVKRPVWRCVIRRLLMLVLVLQLGCANQGLQVGRTPVPGSNIYCLSTQSTKEFRANLKSSDVSYGPFLGRAIGGDSAICDLIQFYTYTVSWETKDGRKEKHEFDLEKTMKKFQEEKPEVKTMNQSYGSPQLIFVYEPDALRIRYEMTQYQLGGIEERNGVRILTKPPIITKFPLLTVPLTSATAAPASN